MSNRIISLTLYYSNVCEGSRQLLLFLQKNPDLRDYFKLVCIDKYFKKHRRFPPDVRGTPTLFEEREDEINAHEADDVFIYMRQLLKKMTSNRRHDDKTHEIMDDPGVSHKKYHGSTNRPDSWGKGTSLNAILEPEEYPEWAMGLDGENNNDPSQLMDLRAKKTDKLSEAATQKSMEALIAQRAADEKIFKAKLKTKPKPGHQRAGFKNRNITV